MRLQKFVGRRQELDGLNLLLKKKVASIVVIKGRRRIGKSRLVEEFAKGKSFYSFSGLAPLKNTSAQDQRDEFMRQYESQTGFPFARFEDWHQVFMLLAQQFKSGRAIILLDELSWMGSKDNQFLSKLKNVWDMYLKKNPKLILVLCSSVSHWIDENLLNSTSFLGRISKQIVLNELSLSQSNCLLKEIGFKGTLYEKLGLLAVTGGVPWYIENIHPSLSALENIKQLCFIKDGLLVNEFDKIFHDLFSERSKTTRNIVTCLISGAKTYSQIGDYLGYAKSGVLSSYLSILTQSGFISRDYSWSLKTGKTLETSRYRLSDNYLRFYLKYIAPNRIKIDKNQFSETALSSFSGWDSLMGLQFENLVISNRALVHRALHIRVEDIVADDPYYQTKTTTRAGCQIDFMIQTRHNTIYVCEVKYSKKTIGVGVIKDMKEKIERLKIPRNMVCHPVLIHASEISESVYDAEYFYEIIDFSSFLEEQIE